jgi:hypothetical protein
MSKSPELTTPSSTLNEAVISTPAVPLDGQFPASGAEAKALGVAWATELQRTLRAENRRVAGGWPGTIREANFRARFLVNQWTLAGAIVNQQQRDSLAKTIYASAKATWHSQSEPEEPDLDVES